MGHAYSFVFPTIHYYRSVRYQQILCSCGITIILYIYTLQVYRVYHGMHGMLDPQSVSLKKVSISHNHCPKPSILTSIPSTWSMPKFSILSRRTNSDMSDAHAATVDIPQSSKKTESRTTDLEATEVMPEANDDISVSEPNSSSSSQQHQRSQCYGSHRRSQRQRYHRRGGKHRWSQHCSFRRRVTEVPPIPEQTEDEDTKDSVVIINTIEVEMIDDSKPTN